MIKTVSLETAKLLKVAGFPQATEFEWYTHDDKEEEAWITNDPGEYTTFGDNLIAAAPTSDEIAITFDFKKLSEEDILKAYGHAFNVPTTRKITAWGLQLCMSDPEIAAKMYLYLAEKGLLK